MYESIYLFIYLFLHLCQMQDRAILISDMFWRVVLQKLQEINVTEISSIRQSACARAAQSMPCVHIGGEAPYNSVSFHFDGESEKYFLRHISGKQQIWSPRWFLWNHCISVCVGAETGIFNLQIFFVFAI